MPGARVACRGVAAALLLIALPAQAGESVVSRRVGHAPELVWATLTDVGAWKRFFPPGAEIAIEPLDANRRKVRATTQMAGVRVRYTLIATMEQPQCQVRFALDRLEPADLRHLESTWRIESVAEGGSQIVLRVVSESGLPVPGFLERRFTEASTRESVEAFVAALAERATADPLAAPGY